MKQILTLTIFPIFQKKGHKNHSLLKKIIESCITERDYEIVLKLLANGKYENTSSSVEPLFHRLGKILNHLKFEIIQEKNEEM